MLNRTLIIAFSFFCFSQTNYNSGIITYKFKPNEASIGKKKENKEFFKAFDYLNEASSNLKFNLEFNNKESFFSLNREMDSDLSKNVTSYAENIITKGKYYFDKEKSIIYREGKMYDKYTLIKTNTSTIKWVITNETKKIGIYNCIKATRQKILKNKNNELTFEIEAWFTTEIPVSYGPLEFNSLPGLILEVKDVNFTFYAQKISLSKDTLDIPKLLSKKIITKKEHEENLKKLRDKN